MGQNTQKRPKQEKWIYPEHKVGRGFNIQPINNVHINVYIPDVRTLKTVQFDLGAWISVDPELTQYDLDKGLFTAKRGIKQYVESIAKKTKMIKKECIVDIYTATLHSKTRTRKHQYLVCDVALYNEGLEFNRHVIEAMCVEMSKYIIENVFIDTRIFNFIKKDGPQYDND